MNHSWYIFLLLINSLLSAFSQVLLKISANKTYKNIFFQYLNPLVVVGYSIFLVVVLLNVYVMKYINMSIVSAFSESLPLILSIFTGFIFFNEKINALKIIGIFIIILGIILICI